MHQVVNLLVFNEDSELLILSNCENKLCRYPEGNKK